MKNNKQTKWLRYLGILALGSMVFAACKKEANMLNTEENQVSQNLTSVRVMTQNYVANEALVKFKKGTPGLARTDAFSKMGARVEELILTKTMKANGESEGIYLINFPSETIQAIEALNSNPQVEYAEPNYIYSHLSSANDPYFTNGSLWGMVNTGYGCGAETAWGNGNVGSSEVVVAVIDEGIDNTHQELSSNCWVNPGETANNQLDDDGNGYIDDIYGWDWDGNNNSTFDGPNDDHATHVAGTIGAIGNNNTGVVGVNWTIQMISCKFLGTNGGTTANAVKAVDYVTDLKKKGINIVATNNSWGGGGFSLTLYDAINRANTADILFIAAAGNNGTNNDKVSSFPANYSISNSVKGKTYPGLSNMIVVAAITSTGTLASFSQYGSKSVHLGAPGLGIYSTLPGNTYGSYSGTSMATPHVTGAAALYKASHPSATGAAIKAEILKATTKISSLSGKCITGGCLNVRGF